MEPTRPLRRECSAVLAANIGRELTELRAALANSRFSLRPSSGLPRHQQGTKCQGGSPLKSTINLCSDTELVSTTR